MLFSVFFGRHALGLLKLREEAAAGDFLYDVQHKDFPERVLCGSETFPAQIGKNWPVVKKRPWVVGDFLWTAWDYLGEAGVGTVSYEKQESFIQPFPCIAAGCAPGKKRAKFT